MAKYRVLRKMPHPVSGAIIDPENDPAEMCVIEVDLSEADAKKAVDAGVLAPVDEPKEKKVIK